MIDSKALKIEFCIFDFINSNDDNSPCRPEPVSKKDSTDFGVIFENNENFLGEIIISYDGVKTRFNDNIYGLVRNMCFRSIKKLILNEEVKLMYFTTHGYINLIPNGNKIEIMGDHFESIKLPYMEFIRAIFNSGKRFTTLFESTAIKTKDNINLINLLKADEKAALAELKKCL
jgi:hypothetical protein